MDTALVILVVLIVFAILLGVVVVILFTRPGSKAATTRLPPGGLVCPGCGRPVPPGAASCSHCQMNLATASLPPGCLVVVSGAGAGQSCMLRPPPRGLVMGRNADNDIVIDAAMVSRHHAQIMVEGDQVVLYDRDSTNGTWLTDGSRVSRHRLSIGDRFQIGDTVFAYALPNQPLPPPPPTRKTQPVAALQAQTYFEGYLLLNVLGRGGMSVVYRAEAPDGKIVAIKVLDATDEWIARKFIQEGNIGSTLRNHPHIRIVYDLRYSQDRRPYLVMEYVEGTSLRKLLGTRMPVSQAIGVVGQTCEALEFAHQRQIVHRDVKPENILVTGDHMVKVTDFGIAKLTSAVTVTSDRIVGTPEYISPEQAKGEEVRPASDIYSLGVVLYELLTGQVPFPLPVMGEDCDQRGAAYTVIRQHIQTAPTPPGRLTPGVTSSLEKATLKALEKDPNRRYAHAMELARALGYQAGQPVRPEPPRPGGAHLIVLAGPRTGQMIPVPDSSCMVLGRALLDANDLQISRQHAILMRKGDEWWVQDTSANGTWVNGQRVYGEAPLVGDRTIEIAGHRLRLQA